MIDKPDEPESGSEAGSTEFRLLLEWRRILIKNGMDIEASMPECVELVERDKALLDVLALSHLKVVDRERKR